MICLFSPPRVIVVKSTKTRHSSKAITLTMTESSLRNECFLCYYKLQCNSQSVKSSSNASIRSFQDPHINTRLRLFSYSKSLLFRVYFGQTSGLVYQNKFPFMGYKAQKGTQNPQNSLRMLIKPF